MAEREPIVGIQYLRGIAAVAVVYCHVYSSTWLPKYFGVESARLLYQGRYGVDLFFLISGFIITIVSLKRGTLEPAIAPGGFFGRRFTRIVPLIWIAIFASMVAKLASGGQPDWGGYFRAATLLPIRGEMIPALVWTLRQEAVFYILFATLFLWLKRGRWLIALWALAPLVAYPLVTTQSGQFDPERVALIATGWRVPLLVFVNEANLYFGLGMAFGLFWLKRETLPVVRLPVDPFPALVALVLLLLLVVAPALGIARGLWMALLLMPVVVLATLVECPPGPLRRIGETLGDASYSIYLFHSLGMALLLHPWSRLAPETPMWLVALIAPIVSTAGGLAAHFVLERPLITLLRRWTGRPVPVVLRGSQA